MDKRVSRQPEYRRVAAALRARIGTEFTVGDMLPSLPQIEQQYNVSKDVARRALMDLQLVGLISTQHGVGSKVEALPSDPEAASPEHETVMRELGRLQAQIDDLAEQMAELRRERKRPPRQQGSQPDPTSS